LKAAQGRFARELSSLDGVFRLVNSFAADAHLDSVMEAELAVATEELFVNAVRHSRGGDGTVDIYLSSETGWLELRLIDHQVEPFDITASPPAELDLPIEQRRSGGMGLHLVRQFADKLSYQHENGDSVITFRRRIPDHDVHRTI